MFEQANLEPAITLLEAQRAVLGDATVDASIAVLRQQLAESETAPPDEQRKLVTVLFADLAGWTALGEQLDPEEVQAIQRAYFDAVTPPIEQHGGSVEKYIGDAVLAVFGVPQAHEDDPERAVRAALAMQDAVAALNTTLATSPSSSSALLTSVLLPSVPLPLSLRIGVHTGLVVSSVDESGDFVVTGDTVNLASRLQSAAEPGTVLISAETHRLAGSAFETEAVGPLAVKGKAEPVSAWRVLAIKPAAPKLRGIAGLDSPLVGRAAEMTALREALNYLQRGVGGIVTVVGEAGIGKSRLLAELRKSQQLSDQRPAITVHWLEGRCLSFGATIPYLLWLDVLRSALGVSLDDPPQVVAVRLRDWMQNLCPERFTDVYPYLARLMALPLEAATLADLAELDGQTLKQRTFQAVEIALTDSANRQPIALVLEDLHWADPSSLELLQHLLPLGDRASLLLIIVFRPHADHGSWTVREVAGREFHHRHTDLWLQPLSAADSETLVGNLLHVNALPQPLRWRILGHAEGNPFFVEEVIRTLIDMQAIAFDEASGRWLVTRDLAEIPIPDTLHGVLVARIDRLESDTKRVLQLASVIGRIFLYRVLAAIAHEERALDDQLLALQQQELIRERARIPELEFIFKHELTREAAYNGILKRQRNQFHRQVAEVLEQLFPDRADEMLGLLAHHWERAQEPEKAVSYLLQAGDRARLAYTHQEAVDYYERALAILRGLGDDERIARTLMRLGVVHSTAFAFDLARQAFDEGSAIWHTVEDQYKPLTGVPPAPHALRMMGPCHIDTFDPRWRNNELFSRLVEQTTELEIIPDVAYRWEISNGGRTYIFHLRDDVFWSDGQRVTANDFEYSLKNALDAAAPPPNMTPLLDIKNAQALNEGKLSDPNQIGIRALDDVTLRIDLEYPVHYFLHTLAFPWAGSPIPRHVVETKGHDWAHDVDVVTNGPFRVERWDPGKLLVLRRNPTYHRPFHGNIDCVELVLESVGDWQYELSLYAEDKIDVLVVSDWPRDALASAVRRYPDDLVVSNKMAVDMLVFNPSIAPFHDARVRQALVMAIDRNRLSSTLWGYNDTPAHGGIIPPEMPGHSPKIGLPYDPDYARRLLADAGFPAGRSFPDPGPVWLTAPICYPAEMFGLLQQMWQHELGIAFDLRTIDPNHLERRALLGTSRFFSFQSWECDYPDPHNVLYDALRGTQICLDASWEECQDMMTTARSLTEQHLRLALYQEVDRNLIESALVMPVRYGRWLRLVKPWVKKLPLSPLAYRRPWRDSVIMPH